MRLEKRDPSHPRQKRFDSPMRHEADGDGHSLRVPGNNNNPNLFNPAWGRPEVWKRPDSGARVTQEPRTVRAAAA